MAKIIRLPNAPSTGKISRIRHPMHNIAVSKIRDHIARNDAYTQSLGEI